MSAVHPVKKQGYAALFHTDISTSSRVLPECEKILLFQHPAGGDGQHSSLPGKDPVSVSGGIIRTVECIHRKVDRICFPTGTSVRLLRQELLRTPVGESGERCCIDLIEQEAITLSLLILLHALAGKQG